MVIVPFKFLPGMMLIGGLACLIESASVDQIVGGLLLSGIGAVWSYHWYIEPHTVE